MSSIPVQIIQSRDNAWLKNLRRLAQDNTAYRKLGQVWVEGDHLYRAAVARGVVPAVGVFAQSWWDDAANQHDPARSAAAKNVVLPDALLRDLSTLESPAPMGFVLDLPAAQPVQPRQASMVLDRVQDAGNVGSILRCASAFGFKQVLALKGTAAVWGSKVLRAGMGAHWGLQVHEGLSVQDIAALQIPLLATSSHQGVDLLQAQRSGQLPSPCAWVMGHEGQGVCAELEALATLRVRIAQPGGEESLNVAAAAAICLYASTPA